MNKLKIMFYLYELSPEFRKNIEGIKRPINLNFIDKTKFQKTYFHSKQTLMIL